MTWRSFAYGLAISRSRATTSRSTAASSSSGVVGERVHPAHERAELALDDEVHAVPLERLDRLGRAGPTRVASTCRMLLPVRSGFCSEPESANSRSMICCVSTNQVWSWPVRVMCASVPSVSKPGK